MQKIDLIYDIVKGIDTKLDKHIENKKLHTNPLTVKDLCVGFSKFAGIVTAVIAVLKLF